VIDAQGRRVSTENMIASISQADAALTTVPADGNCTIAIMKGECDTEDVQGQTLQHPPSTNVLSVRRTCIGVNKMDRDVDDYRRSRYDEAGNEMMSKLAKVGWKKDSIDKKVPVLPISG